MAKHLLLNNITHKDLKIIARHSPAFGDNVGSTLTFPTEFADVHREYPILFQKNPDTGKFQSVVLLGLKSNENLFLDEFGGWKANYIPAVIERGPFLIGFQDQSRDGGSERTPVIHVDMEHPRISETEGEAVFLDHGGLSPYLEKISKILNRIYDGMQISDAMFAAFAELDLIEPVNLEIELNDREVYRLHGNYTIHQEKLANLDGADLERLNRSGFLRCAFLAVESLGNIQRLVQLKTARG
jgi:hypothetical protein